MSTIEVENILFKRLEILEKEVGNTPLFDFSALLENGTVKLFGKLEWKQISGSVKARAAFGIIKSAIERGELNEDVEILDASSGNTGIAYAFIAKGLGLKITLVIPENASQKRKEILNALGARVIFSSPFEGTDGAQELAKELKEEFPDRFYYADQYNNEANWIKHYQTTGPEIWNQTNEKVTHFAASLGTTGTFTGIGRYLKDKNPNVCLIQMQPDSPMHGLEGWKHLETAKVPGIFDFRLADKNIEVNSEDALEMIKTVYEKFNLRISPSAAASLVGAKSIAEKLSTGTVVTVLADDGTKYEEVYNEINLPPLEGNERVDQVRKKPPP